MNTEEVNANQGAAMLAQLRRMTKNEAQMTLRLAAPGLRVKVVSSLKAAGATAEELER